MSRYRAVLFDWMLTLAHYPTDVEFLHAVLGSRCDHDEIAGYCAALADVDRGGELRALFAVEDTSTEAHRLANLTRYRRAGIPDDLAECLYRELGGAAHHPLYADVGATLRSIAAAGLAIAVVSDIHIDLRLHAAAFGIDPYIDVWALSYELGVQKPDPLIFIAALDLLDVEPAAALMVGDRATHDGGAAAIGIDTLVLPAVATATTFRGLDRVGRLLGLG